MSFVARWVPLTEEMPPEGVRVGVLMEGGHIDCAEYWPNMDVWLTPDSCELRKVSHWCQFPPIPAQQNEEAARVGEQQNSAEG